MSGWSEPHPEVITPNAGGRDDPLGESVLDPALPAVRVFIPHHVRVVIGRGQNPQRELNLAAIHADQVPIHRRVSGGGAVVLAPDMVVVALRLPSDVCDPDQHFSRVNAVLIPAMADVGVVVACRGHGDLTVNNPLAGGPAQKVLGASLRQDRHGAYYLGVFMVADAMALIERYLARPSREPAYRGGRDHRDFCTNLGRFGVDSAAVLHAVTARLTDHHWGTSLPPCRMP